jgi:hypothetical protein
MKSQPAKVVMPTAATIDKMARTRIVSNSEKALGYGSSSPNGAIGL